MTGEDATGTILLAFVSTHPAAAAADDDDDVLS